MGNVKYYLPIISAIIVLLSTSCSRYDHKTPDSAANRKGFSQILRQKPGPEVKNVFFYADEWGGDAVYVLAFEAPASVIDRIVGELKLTPRPNDAFRAPYNVPAELTWWRADEREKSQFYANHGEKVESMLWYNPDAKKCQYLMICL